MRPFIKKQFALWGIMIGAVLATLSIGNQANSQVVDLDQRFQRFNSWHWRAPTDSVAMQIHVQAGIQRALGESAVDLATARMINAEANRLEIENSLAEVQAAREKEVLVRAANLYIAPLDRERLRKSKQWDWLEKDPNFAPEAIQTGRAMNLLLDRLAMTALAYSYTSTHSQDDQELRKRLKLEPAIIHQLFLKESVGRTGLRFRADGREALTIEWWPWIFRHEKDLQKPREQFDQARKDLVNNLAKNETPQKLQTLLDRYWDLKISLDRWFGDHKRDPVFVAQGNPTHYLDSKRFLESVFGEIHRLQRTGSSSILVGPTKFEGDNLFDLMAFMSKSALKFDAAQPGEEAGYHQVFQMMRDLFVTVDDAWMKDKEAIKKIEEKRPK